ncbi:MAG: S-adenosylmethionine decarboxylase [Gammaproteobacteria bacterium]|nr:S-adenosylmethionine decarboxylase [Gammaproteobacteria bacterium]
MTVDSLAEKHFGEHFMIDAYLGSREKLQDRERVQRCLHELPTVLGMQKLAEPTVYWAEPNGIKDPGGWSGVVVIAESHISIHTFPGRRPALQASIFTPAAMGSPLQRSRHISPECSTLPNWKRISSYAGKNTRWSITDVSLHLSQL